MDKITIHFGKQTIFTTTACHMLNDLYYVEWFTSLNNLYSVQVLACWNIICATSYSFTTLSKLQYDE